MLRKCEARTQKNVFEVASNISSIPSVCAVVLCMKNRGEEKDNMWMVGSKSKTNTHFPELHKDALDM